MKILKKGITPNGTPIQIEDWNENYSFMPYGSTLGTYPKSKQTLEGKFSPNINEKFRFELDFNTHEEAQQAFNNLLTGKNELIDYKQFHKGKNELLSCV